MSQRFSNKVNTVSSKQNFAQGPVTKMENTTFTYIPPITDPSYTSNIYSNLWSYLGYYTRQDGLDKNIPYNKGGLLGTFLNDIPIAFLSGGTIMFQISNTEYPTQLSSTDIRLKIPLTGTTTATTLYSSYVKTPELFKQATNDNCGISIVGDNLVSGDLWPGFSDIGIGYAKSQGNNNNTVEGYPVTNVVAMFSDDWEFSGTTTGLTSWSYGFGFPLGKNLSRKYIQDSRTAHPYSTTSLGVSGTSFSDRCCGIFLPINGIGFIFGEFVDNFDWGSATGGTGTTEVTFPISHAAVESRPVDFETVLNISMVIPEEDANSSNNKTWVEAVNYSGEICGTMLQEMCFEDSNRVPLMIVKFNEENLPMKNKNNTLVFQFGAPIGPPITLGTPNPYTGVFTCDVGTCPKYI